MASYFEEPTYEIESKQVRQYRTNDISTVKRAIIINIEEYLADEGVSYDLRTENLRLCLGALSVVAGAGTYLACLWPFRVPFLVMKPFLLASVVLYNIVAAGMYYLHKFVDADTFFISSPNAKYVGQDSLKSPNSKVNQQKKEQASKGKKEVKNNKVKENTPKASPVSASPSQVMTLPPLGEKLEGHRVRLVTRTEPFSPFMEFGVELLDLKVEWYRPARVIRRVERKYAVGRYFDEKGLIYPPQLKEDTYEMISELMDKKCK